MRSHIVDNRLRYGCDDTYNKPAQALLPYWAERVVSGKGIHDFWRGKPPTLIDPSRIWNHIYRLIYGGVRVPVPLAHFAWRPM